MLVETLLGTQPGLGNHSHYEATGALWVEKLRKSND